MDLLQIALIFLILLLSILLSVLGIQVFFILKDLKRSLDKFELLLSNAQDVAEDVGKPLRAAADITETVETGVKAVKKTAQSKPVKRLLFKRR